MISLCCQTAPLRPYVQIEQPPSQLPPPSAQSDAVRTGCRSRLDARMTQELQRIQNAFPGGASPLRSGIFDVILPRTIEEHQKLNAMALFAVQVFSQSDVKENPDLPIDAVLHSPTGKDGNPERDSLISKLPGIFPLSRVKGMRADQEAAEKEAVRVFGKSTQIFYGFIPMKTLLQNGVVGVRFKSLGRILELFETGPHLLKKMPELKWLQAHLKKANRPGKRKSSAVPPVLPLLSEIEFDPLRVPDPETTLKLLRENYCVGLGL